MLALILIIPLLLGVAVLALAKSEHAKYIALGASIVSLALAPLVSQGTAYLQWLNIGKYSIDIAVSTGAINTVLIYLVAAMSPLILFYSFGFMDMPSEQKRYYAEMLSFESAMLLFAMSGGFVLFFIAWEFLSLTSYLLIGFWYNREKAVKAARKAISIVFIGDIALFASIIIFASTYGTLNFAEIISSATTQSDALYAAVSLLLIAIFTKSAQFPFHEWLADAMEGPAPVSAMLHSTTMVKAGVFAAIILLPLLIVTHMGIYLIIFGAITAVLSTLDAMREQHVKRVLAYSTMQELSLMLIAVGANALIAAIYFFIAQSFYKALLFFSSGAMMKATNKERINEISGLSSNRLLFVSTAFGVLALAGFFPFDGFFASMGIASAALMTNTAVYVLLSALSMLTSFFIFRWLSACTKPSGSEATAIAYRATPKSMTYSTAILAAAALLAGILFITLPYALSSVPILNKGMPLEINGLDMIIEMALVSIGAIIAIHTYSKHKHTQEITHSTVADKLQTTPAFNLFYYYLARFVYVFAEGVALFDLYIDNIVEQVGASISQLGKSTRHIATGSINAYAALFALGFLIVVIALLW